MLKMIMKTSAAALIGISALGGAASSTQASVLDAIATDPLLHKAERALLKGHYERVVKLLQDESFSKARERAHASSLMCQADYQLGHFDTAISHCTTALGEAKPNWVDYHVRAGAYYQLGQYSSALRDFEAAARLAPNHARVKSNLEIARMAAEDTKLAQNQ